MTLSGGRLLFPILVASYSDWDENDILAWFGATLAARQRWIMCMDDHNAMKVYAWAQMASPSTQGTGMGGTDRQTATRETQLMTSTRQAA